MLYEDGEDNIVEENYIIFSLIRNPNALVGVSRAHGP